MKRGSIMGFDPKKPLKSLIYGILHPREFLMHKPIFALACYVGMGVGAYFLGVSKGWWNSLF